MRALGKVRNKDEKVPLFFDEPPHFFEKDVAFSQRVLGRHDKVQLRFTKFCKSARQGGEIHYISLALPPKSLIFAGKHSLWRPPCAALSHRYEETAVSPPQCRGLFPHGQQSAHG